MGTTNITVPCPKCGADVACHENPDDRIGTAMRILGSISPAQKQLVKRCENCEHLVTLDVSINRVVPQEAP